MHDQEPGVSAKSGATLPACKKKCHAVTVYHLPSSLQMLVIPIAACPSEAGLTFAPRLPFAVLALVESCDAKAKTPFARGCEWARKKTGKQIPKPRSDTPRRLFGREAQTLRAAAARSCKRQLELERGWASSRRGSFDVSERSQGQGRSETAQSRARSERWWHGHGQIHGSDAAEASAYRGSSTGAGSPIQVTPAATTGAPGRCILAEASPKLTSF